MAEFKLPTEVIDLPSKGLLYPKDNPLSEGKIELKYMTAKEEDILSNSSYIRQGIVLDKLFKSLIVTKINYNDLLIGDKNAIMVASRVLGYGNDYEFEYDGEKQTVDLSKIEFNVIDEKLFENGNSFSFTLPVSKNTVTFKLLTHGDEVKIANEIKSLKKINKASDTTISTRLKHMITSIEGDTDLKKIREYVDKYMLARDSRALREYAKKITPDVDLSFFPDGQDDKASIPVGLSFFWPDIK